MKSIAKKVGIVLLAFVVLLALYGVLIEPNLIDVEEETAVIPGLPPAWEGKRIAAIGDMQVGMWLANTSTIRLPFTPEWSWITFRLEDEVHADGWIDGYGAPGNRLYVNRGIGFSVLPIRINCPPEITMFTLSGAAAGEHR